MPKSHYDWEVGQPLPELKRHSQIKHEIVRDYITAYIDTVVRLTYDQMKLTLVDGFAGGGEYRLAGTTEVVPGSPLILLQTTMEAAIRHNQGRHKSFHLDAQFYFVEKKKSNYLYLKSCLGAHGYGGDTRIHLLNGEFHAHEGKIIEEIQKRGRACRSIFLLDQYGYNQVPTDHINKILKSLPKAEIILTFNVDSLITYLDNRNWANFARAINAPELIRLNIEDLKRQHKSIRRLIQEYLIRHLSQACGAEFFTPFFIQNSEGHGEYWLIHFSQHPKARDVMTTIHWAKKNYFVTYSHPGIDRSGTLKFQALGFSDHLERLHHANHEFHFDSSSTCLDALVDDIPHIFTPENHTIRVGDFIGQIANHSPASREIIHDAFQLLLNSKEIFICDENGKLKRSARDLKDADCVGHKFQIRLL